MLGNSRVPYFRSLAADLQCPACCSARHDQQHRDSVFFFFFLTDDSVECRFTKRGIQIEQAFGC